MVYIFFYRCTSILEPVFVLEVTVVFSGLCVLWDLCLVSLHNGIKFLNWLLIGYFSSSVVHGID